MSKFSVPTRDQVSSSNQTVFDKLEKSLGFVPNLYAYYAKNDTALEDYLRFQGRKSTLKAREREVINLVVSQYNGCEYCQAAHTALGKLNGFTDAEIIELRTGNASFDPKLNALAEFSLSIVSNRGQVNDLAKDAFFKAGYSEANMIDVVFVIGDKIISNYIHNLAGFKIDFPLAPSLTTEGSLA